MPSSDRPQAPPQASREPSSAERRRSPVPKSLLLCGDGQTVPALHELSQAHCRPDKLPFFCDLMKS